MLELKLKQPTKLYKNLEDARVTRSFSQEKAENGEYPCIYCHGSGKQIAPGEQCDPIEGFTRARKVACPQCEGTGAWAKKRFHAWYKKNHSDLYKEEMKEWHRKKSILERLKNRLAIQEIEVLLDAFRDTYGS